MTILLIWTERNAEKTLMQRVQEAMDYYRGMYMLEPNTVHVPATWPDAQINELVRQTGRVFVDVPICDPDEIWVTHEIELP
jgi:hypothetical protein